MLILLFIRISYLLKVFRVDSGILRDSFAVPLLKTLSQLPQSVAFYALFCFTRLLANFPFRAFVTRICWTLTEALLNLIACLYSAVLSLDFEQINIFWTSGFDSVSIIFDSVWLKVNRRNPEFHYRILFRCSFILRWVNQYMVYAFDSISIGQFSAMVYSISVEGSLNLVPH